MSGKNATNSRLSVLVADDSAALRQRLLETLSAVEGLEVIGETQDVPETLAFIQKLRPAVLILDIQMPGGSGIDVLREIKHEYPEIMVVILTNHDEPQYRKRCFELKADYFLSKSTGASQLLAICTRMAVPDEA